MPIPIKGELVRSLIDHRFGSVDNLVVEWEHRSGSQSLRRGKPRDRATVYRWLKEGLPSKADELFGFAALLDVDPISLIQIDGRYVEQHFAKERYLFHIKRPQGTYLAPLWALYLADAGWPNQPLAERYYGRRWHLTDFSHDPETNEKGYAAVVLNCHEKDSAVPRAYHFAYRRVGVSDRTWRPYGVVLGLEREVLLLAESGNFQAQPRTEEPIVAETYFGAGPAEFRVVSIHPFQLDLEVPSARDGVVRFWA